MRIPYRSTHLKRAGLAADAPTREFCSRDEVDDLEERKEQSLLARLLLRNRMNMDQQGRTRVQDEGVVDHFVQVVGRGRKTTGP